MTPEERVRMKEWKKTRLTTRRDRLSQPYWLLAFTCSKYWPTCGNTSVCRQKRKRQRLSHNTNFYNNSRLWWQYSDKTGESHAHLSQPPFSPSFCSPLEHLAGVHKYWPDALESKSSVHDLSLRKEEQALALYNILGINVTWLCEAVCESWEITEYKNLNVMGRSIKQVMSISTECLASIDTLSEHLSRLFFYNSTTPHHLHSPQCTCHMSERWENAYHTTSVTVSVAELGTCGLWMYTCTYEAANKCWATFQKKKAKINPRNVTWLASGNMALEK